MRPASPGFIAGAVVGGGLAALAAGLADPLRAGDWVARNLGHSVWAFGAVIAAWTLAMVRLDAALGGERGGERGGDGHGASDDGDRIVQLDQLTDVATSLVVGIGVVWTAVGMRAALQTTLGDAETALQGSAGTVLASLVDGGILLALTTTIVGAVGGYLMRLAKTLRVGPALHRHHEAMQVREVRALVDAVTRIERCVDPRAVRSTEGRFSGGGSDEAGSEESGSSGGRRAEAPSTVAAMETNRAPAH